MTVSGPSQDFLRTFSELYQGFPRNFSGLSQGLLKHPDMLNLFTQAKDVKDIEDVDSLPHVPNIDPKEIFCEAFRALQEYNPDFAVANNSMSHCKIRYN